MLQYKDITEQTKELIALDYNQGMNFDLLAHKYTNICKDLIVLCLYEKADVPKRSYLPNSRSIEWKQAVVDYYSNHSSGATVIYFRTSQTVLGRVLEELSIDKRTKQEETLLRHIELYGSHELYKEHMLASLQATMLNRYGTYNFAKSSLFNDRCEATCMKKYGVKNPMLSDIAKLNMKQHNQEKYGVDWCCLLPHVRQSLNGANSKPNLAFLKLLDDYNITYVREKNISNYSYDFLIDKDILVEINPTSTHNADWGAFSPDPLPESYHQEKYDTAVEAGYRCVMLWDWDTAESFVLSLAGVYVSSNVLQYLDENLVKIDSYISIEKFTQIVSSLPENIRICVDSDKIFDSRYNDLQLVACTPHEVYVDIRTNEIMSDYVNKHVCKIILPEIFIYTL